MKNTCETISFPVFLSFNQSIDNDPWRLAVTSCSGWPVLIPCWSEDGQWRARRDMYALPGPEHGTLAERPFCCGHGCMGNCVFFCFDFLPSWVLSRQKISDWRRIRMRLHMAFGYCSLYGSPQTENGRSVSPFQYDLCKEKGGGFPDFRLVFVGSRNGTHPGVQGIIFPDGMVHWGMQQDGPVSQLPLRARLLVHWHLDWIWRQLLWWLDWSRSIPRIFFVIFPETMVFWCFLQGIPESWPFRGVWYWDGLGLSETLELDLRYSVKLETWWMNISHCILTGQNSDVNIRAHLTEYKFLNSWDVKTRITGSGPLGPQSPSWQWPRKSAKHGALPGLWLMLMMTMIPMMTDDNRIEMIHL